MTTTELSAGTLLVDRYEVARPIGSGGMATVYVARDRKHSRDVAIKLLRPEIGESVGVERFLREINIAATLQHPNILSLYDSGEWNGQLFYVMPLIEGESLRERLSRAPRLTVAEIVEITNKIALALDYSHARDVIHRDIKPENIMLTGGSVVVADFGIARAISGGTTNLTQTGLAIGTPVYMSPEHASGAHDTTPASDQYSLACTVYEMLTGDAPFLGTTAQAIIMRHWRDDVPSLKSRGVKVPPGVEAAIVRALSKEPENRFESVGAFAAAIAEGAASSGSLLAAFGPRRPWRRRAAVIAGALALVSLAAVGVVSVANRLRGTGAPAEGPLVVVLPFTHTGRPEDNYVAAGLTDEITDRIAGIRSLRTISSASAVQYANRPLDQISHDLGARYAVTGSIGTEMLATGVLRMRVLAHLTDLTTHREREILSAPVIADIVAGRLFDVQAKIARGVATALSLTLAPNEQKAMDASATSSPEAYEYYLRAAPYSSLDFEERSTQTAMAMYERAVKADSTFTLAWAKLGELRTLNYYFYNRSQQQLALAKAAVDRAMALDPSLPESRVALGYLYYFGNLDYARALTQFTSVLAEQPNNSELLWVMGSLARRNNRLSDARPLHERATVLNPRSRLFALELGVTLMYQRDYPRAQREFQRCISIDPTWYACYLQGSVIAELWHGDLEGRRQWLRNGMAHAGRSQPLEWMLTGNDRWDLDSFGPEFQVLLESLNLGLTNIDSGSYYLALADWRRAQHDSTAARAAAGAALRILERQVKQRPESPELHGSLGVAYAGVGRHDDAIREGVAATRLVPTERDGFRGPTYERTLLEIYLLLGEVDLAAKLTQRLVHIPVELSLPYVKVDPHFEAVRNAPQFQALLREGSTGN